MGCSRIGENDVIVELIVAAGGVYSLLFRPVNKVRGLNNANVAHKGEGAVARLAEKEFLGVVKGVCILVGVGSVYDGDIIITGLVLSSVIAEIFVVFLPPYRP